MRFKRHLRKNTHKQPKEWFKRPLKPIITLLISVFIFSSCFKEDEMIEPHQSGDVQEATFEMTSSYLYQFYFDLGTNTILSVNEITDWDLRFECVDTGFHILTNNSNKMSVLVLKNSSFDTIITKPKVDSLWRWDSPEGDLDKLAIGEWGWFENDSFKSYNYVYIIDRGIDELGDYLGFKKMQVLSLENNSYTIRYANLDGSDENIISIDKNSAVNYTYFSFSGIQLDLEPPKNDWDLLFSRYREPLIAGPGDTLQYLVVGAYLNPYLVKAGKMESDTIFEDVKYEDIHDSILGNATNAIGHDWKVFDLKNGMYKVLSEYIFIVKDTEGFLYKFRFVDFYDKGEKGYPKIEFQRL